MSEKMTPVMWEGIMKTRCWTHMSVNMLALRDTVPSQVGKQVEKQIKEEDARVRGNRPFGTPPSWRDAELCLEATLRFALKMLEEIQRERPKPGQ